MLLWSCMSGTLQSYWLLALIPLILFSWNNCLKKQAWRTDTSAIKEMIYLPSLNLWLIKSVDNPLRLARLCSDSVLIFGFAFLKFKAEKRFFPIPVLISKEAVSQRQFRQLQVWWRF
ncbi:MAG: hypothetical protein HKM04_12055 [Legionellales bacterium]|nr:hypothetical protein [Legionellales bacterium]